ncbi:DUF1292 domain-containing protein [Texcoconibacillus texcoconensis]|uniref:UPF0473 protein HNQ41_001343 n=1 Tax=Texcoconibacillus texcoconensis TaxID=1095777 RepID=A0A840QP70_9BACI|nr:DUF1292 domain-containing protein [Texcoconibacillus texcoconensis]MBB5173174.1 uncharacterized protein YrzB (UPF0473 family) [Texcoconibacillus texcoconensis]
MDQSKINQPTEQERVVIPDENGDEHLFEVLFTFDVDETENSYMVLVPEGSQDNEEEEVEVHAFRYEENDEGELSLIPIEDEEEWNMVEEMLNTYIEMSENNEV